MNLRKAGAMRRTLFIGTAVLVLIPAAAAAADSLNPTGTHFIFVTSTAYQGDLGGLAGADALCASLAAGGLLTGNLGLTWKALISVHGVVDAKDRVSWAGPVYDVAGNLATNDPVTWPWVKNGTSTIGVNENGGSPGESYVWTGSDVTGVSVGPGYDCNGWTDSTNTYEGWSGETDYFDYPQWIDSFHHECDDPWFTLYCVSVFDGPIFSDGFETGDTSAWSVTVP